MITFPKKIEEITKDGEIRAGGTDLQERRHKKSSTGPLIDLRDLAGLDTIEASGAGLRLGTKVTIEAIANGGQGLAAYPGLIQTAAGLATPQIRHTATLGGNLLQRVRCWYYRSPEAKCLKKGGGACLAREGDHLFHACIDLGPCIAPHASSMGMALLAYEATIELADNQTLSAEGLFGDGQDPTREHTLPPGSFLRAVSLPAPVANERAAYVRVISRARAEWPLVEVLVRLVVDNGTITLARVAMGGVANIPLRLKSVEALLEGKPAIEDTWRNAAKPAAEGVSMALETRYKAPMIVTAIEDALQKAAMTGQK
jgi:xanthine dehydrogenase YagS FAD-binding subunit